MITSFFQYSTNILSSLFSYIFLNSRAFKENSVDPDQLASDEASSCLDPENFVRGGPTMTFYFNLLIDEEREEPYSTKSGPLSALCQ